jgi:hypothetical protein
MQTHSMNSLLKYFDINLPTWARGPLQSQIDDIWISSTLMPNITQPELINAELITNSDHRIISTIWQPDINMKKYRPKIKKRSIFQYNQMKPDDWIEFKDDVNKYLKQQENKLPQAINTEEELNKSWHILNKAIKQAANNNIPKTKISPKIHYAFSKKATKLHTALQSINQIIRYLKKDNPLLDLPMIQEINHKVDKINNYTEMQIPKLNQSHNTSTTLENTLQLLKHQQKAIYQARKIENNMAYKQKIKNNIIK